MVARGFDAVTGLRDFAAAGGVLVLAGAFARAEGVAVCFLVVFFEAMIVQVGFGDRTTQAGRARQVAGKMICMNEGQMQYPCVSNLQRAEEPAFIRVADRLPGPDHLGGWSILALALSVMLHLAVFLLLDRMDFSLRYRNVAEINTQPIRIRQVDAKAADADAPAAPEAEVTPPVQAAALMEEVDLLAALPEDREIDIKPQIEQAEYALQLSDPASRAGRDDAASDALRQYEFDAGMPELGREPEAIEPSAIGRLTVDPGTMVPGETGAWDAGESLRDSIGRGASEGAATLDEMLELPPNLLLASHTMLPGDLLFEFNSADLRESAKVGLMKLGLLMDRNPSMHCWIDGHADLVGGDAFNLDLSRRRAAAVKRYLTESLRMDDSKIHPRGFGRSRPLVTTGGIDAQSVNRRVEIKMRATPPPPSEEPVIRPAIDAAPKASPVDSIDADAAAAAVPRAEPVDEAEPQPAAVPRAMPVDE